MDWDEMYQNGEVPWDKGAPSPAMKQYLERHSMRGRALVPGCGRGHEVALAVEYGLDATGLDIAPTAARLLGFEMPRAEGVPMVGVLDERGKQ